MSADLLAGFDPYYVPPNADSSNGSKSSAPAASGSMIEELSFFNPPHASTALQNGTTLARNSQEPRNMELSSDAPEDDIDAWGDFVAPAASPPNSSSTSIPQKPYGDLDDHFGPFNQQTVPPRGPTRPPVRMRAPTQDFFSGKITSWVDKGDPSQPIGRPKHTEQPSILNRKAKPAHKSNPDVLFDAEDLSEEEEDDFGDFEMAQNSPPRPPPQKQPDLLDDDIDALSVTMSQLGMPPASRHKAPLELNPFAEIGSSQASAASSATTSPRVITPWPAYEKPKLEAKLRKSPVKRPPPQQTNWDDAIEETVSKGKPETIVDDSWGWGDENVPVMAVPKTQTATSVAPSEPTQVQAVDEAWGWDAEDSPVGTSQPEIKDDSPPTNVPPPTVLMAYLPDAFMPLQASLFAPGLKQKILSTPSLLKFLKAYLSIGIVAAHVVAGRKSRWKRDKILSQSMSMGQAGARGKSGMKLMGVDKAEAAREDREAGDFVRWWKDQAGRLRSAVAAANLTIPDHSAHLTVPEINETMPVRTATLDEGALTTPKCCFLCGLKRDERLLKIDGKVEDSFSEWWVEHWGHRTCRDFWVEHSEKLKHR